MMMGTLPTYDDGSVPTNDDGSEPTYDDDGNVPTYDDDEDGRVKVCSCRRGSRGTPWRQSGCRLRLRSNPAQLQ